MKASLSAAPAVSQTHPGAAKRDYLAGLPGAAWPQAVDKAACVERLAECLQRRAIEAVVWGMPMVQFDALRQAFFRDAQASYGDVAYWSQPADWTFQLTAPPASGFYTYFNFNTREGPVVFDLTGSLAASVSGSIFNARDERLMDVGVRGADKGHGAKYLLLPPQYRAIVPSGYIPVRCSTYNGYALFNQFQMSSATEDDHSLVQSMRVYPLARASDPPPQRFIDMSGRIFDAAVRFDDTFFDSLARMVNEERPQVCDLVVMNQIHALGIEPGKVFEPDLVTREILKRSAGKVHESLMERVRKGEPWWPSASWKSAVLWPKTPFSEDVARRLGIDDRNIRFFLAFASRKEHSEAFCSLGAFSDGMEEPLSGEFSYRLDIPSDVPAKENWTVTAYDLHTACFIRESPRVAIDSNDRTLKHNADGSVDLYFGPRAPDGEESNWIYTAPGKRWFAVLRLYAPEKAFFDKAWKLPNFEKIR